MTLIKILITALLLNLLFLSNAYANKSEKNWLLVTDDNGVQVYTLETPNSKIVKAKAITTIRAPIEKIQAVLDDVDHRHQWIPFLVVSKTLSKYENNKRIEYSHFFAPWPAYDRDFVYEIELVIKTKDRLVYKMQSVNSSLMPANQDKIRADLFETTYELIAVDAQTTKVELIYHADPKGWIPNWIINIMQRILPYKIMNNLAERVLK